MAVMNMTQNMGKTDRMVRGMMGGAMLLDGLMHIGNSTGRRVETLIGGAFLFYGATGFDPLLKAFGVSTIPGTENNLMNRLKQATPGQGVNPMMTQQAVPQGEL